MSERLIPQVDQEIIEQTSDALQETYEARTAHEAAKEAARVELEEAKAVLKAAEDLAKEAANRHQSLSAADQQVDRDIVKVANEEARRIVAEPTLDPLTKTLHALILQDDTLARKSSKDTYGSAAYKARQAIDEIFERLQPGVPIVEFGTSFRSEKAITVSAGVATNDTFAVTPPKVNTNSYTRLEGGSVQLVLPQASKTVSIDRGLAELRDPLDHEIDLISSHWEHDHERLERIATNTSWITIGETEIATKLKDLDQSYRIAALLALHASGVTLDVEPKIIDQLRSTLISGLSMVASGRTPHKTEYRNAVISEARPSRNGRGWSEGVRASSDSLLVVMQSLKRPTIKSLLDIAKLDKETFKAEASKSLEISSKKNDLSISQLAENSRVIAGLDLFADSLFTEELQETGESHA